MIRHAVRRGPTAALALAAFAFVATAATAQDEGRGPAATQFFDRIDVEVVNVEVFVTDKQGNPIRGLTADDFRIFEDGHERGISNFYAAEGVRAIPEPEMVESLDDLLRDETQPRDLEPVPVREPLHLVLFVDNRNIRPAHRNRVLDAIRDDLLDDLDAATRVTVVAYDGKMELRTLPASDRRDVDSALEDLVQGSAGGELDTLQKTSILRELEQVGISQGLGGTDRRAEELDSVLSDMYVYAQSQSDRVRSTVATLSQLVSMLSGLEGHKALVYVSDGLSLNPGEALFRAYDRRAAFVPRAPQINPDSEGRSFHAEALFEQLGKQANASRVTFYTVLAGGGGSVTLNPAERPAFIDLADTTDLGRVWDESLEAVEHSNQRGSMEILAVATGGRATVSASDFSSAVDDLRQDLRSFYSLGFRSEGANEGKDRRIRVRVGNDDWVVRHRETFRSLSADERMAAVTRSALMFENARDPLGIRVDFGQPEPEGRGEDRWLVPILVKFPLARVTLVPGPSVHQGSVTIFVSTRGPGGDLSPVQKLDVPIRVPNDKMHLALGQVAGYPLRLLMRKGEHKIAITVRDEIADTSASTLLTYEPTAKARPGSAQGGTP